MDREENDGSGSGTGIRNQSATETELVKRLVQCCLVGTTTSSLALRATANGGCGLDLAPADQTSGFQAFDGQMCRHGRHIPTRRKTTCLPSGD
jgi:hypothetical protein